MELKDYILMELAGLERNVERVTSGLTDAEIAWRPCSGCNSIGLILFHIARSEDSFVQKTLKGGTELWETGRWWEKLKMPRDEAGAHYTTEQVNAFPTPKLAPLLRFYKAVAAQTVKYVKSLKKGDFDELVKMGGPFGDAPRAAIFSLIVNHNAGHIGEMSYLRGMQRGQEPMGPPPEKK